MPKQLMEGERSITLSRQHPLVVLPPLIAGFVLLAVVIVVLVLIPGAVGSLNVGGVKLAIGIAFGVVVGIWSLVHYLRWRFQTYLLTDRRIVLDRGVISRFSESIALDRIQNTMIKRPLGDRLIGAGEIEIESAGRDGVEVLHRIPSAERFYNELLQAMDANRLSPRQPLSGGTG
jgi:uncharacterized membrane protein YdbT with pleckstrin-like domain